LATTRKLHQQFNIKIRKILSIVFNREKKDSSKCLPLGSCYGFKQDRILSTGLIYFYSNSNVFSLLTELPYPITSASLIGDSRGSVYLVGGFSNTKQFQTTIFKLEHAGPDQKWVELDVKLKIGRYRASVTFIPDEIANCTLN
jgi:hypothetical protein